MQIHFEAISYNFYSKLINSVWVEIEIWANNYEFISNQLEFSTALHEFHPEQYHHFYSKRIDQQFLNCNRGASKLWTQFQSV